MTGSDEMGRLAGWLRPTFLLLCKSLLRAAFHKKRFSNFKLLNENLLQSLIIFYASRRTLYFIKNKLQGFLRFLGLFQIFIAGIS
jgi:hypothetical protein